jgi:gluconate kinase
MTDDLHSHATAEKMRQRHSPGRCRSQARLETLRTLIRESLYKGDSAVLVRSALKKSCRSSSNCLVPSVGVI